MDTADEYLAKMIAAGYRSPYHSLSSLLASYRAAYLVGRVSEANGRIPDAGGWFGGANARLHVVGEPPDTRVILLFTSVKESSRAVSHQAR